MKAEVLSLVYLGVPVLLIRIEKNIPLLRKVGLGLVCYGIGIFMATAGLVPSDSAAVQNLFLTLCVPLAVPLLLFSSDVRGWLHMAGKTALAVAGMFVSVLIAVITGYVLFGNTIDEGWKVGGMAVGVYTGGSANLNSIGLALKAAQNTLVLTNTADMLACFPWFLFILTAARPILSRLLPPVKVPVHAGSAVNEIAEQESGLEVEDLDNYKGIFTRRYVIPLVKVFILDVLIFAAAGILYSFVPEDYNMAALMLTVTTLGILGSLNKKIRETEKSFQLGQYFVLVFCIVVGSMADILSLTVSVWGVFAFITYIVYVSFILHILFCRLFSIDVDTAIITSVAALFSPPFVPVVARRLNNRNVIISGLIAGTLGYAAGNYLGIITGYLLRGL